MRDEKSKYLIIDAADFTRQSYTSERVFSCNDFYTFYHRAGKTSASEIFNNNNIPEEFHKIIIKMNTSFFSEREAEEYTMKFPFIYSLKSIKEKNKTKLISIQNSPIYHNECLFTDKFVCESEVEYKNFDDVMEYLENIYKKGHLESYLQSIREFFDVSLDLNLLYDSWNKTHNKQKALRLYKHEIAQNSMKNLK